jgi:chemotaxis protein MotA
VLARFRIAILALAVSSATLLQILAPASAVVAIVAGLTLVLAGTLLMAHLSHSRAALGSLRAVLRGLRTDEGTGAADDQRFEWFFRAAKFFRYGNIRPAEEAARLIPGAVLRRGTQLVLDGLPRQQLGIALQRQVAEERERLLAPVELLRQMAGYAPTLGMLGTLLGLLQMLFGVGSGDVARMGAAMGFAMLTTVYGLVVANLVLKPLASKLEHRNRRLLGQSLVDLQAVLLLQERQHPAYIRDVINDSRVEPEPGGTGAVEIAGAYTGSY